MHAWPFVLLHQHYPGGVLLRVCQEREQPPSREGTSGERFGANCAGREGRRIGREAAARIVALREQNYEEYLRLARTTKDKRLRTLLDKTDAIISDLGLKVLHCLLLV